MLAQGEQAKTNSTRHVLNKCTLVVDANQPRYVQHAVEDLQSYLKEITGEEVKLSSSLARRGTSIAIGPKFAAKVLSETPSAEKLGDEGFVLKSAAKGRKDYLAVSGASPKGTKFAIYELMKRIRCEDRRAYLDGPVELQSTPTFKLRGVHLNGWAFGYPYSFRRWPEQDWKRYADMLSYQGVNLFYIWPFMEIMPVPLSKEDEEYLQEFRRVVDYAQREHGMEVWMMQAANRVATSNLNVLDPRARPYWRPCQKDLNPADPEQFQKIMDSRKELIRIVNNVDGLCTIDSDPGGWKNAPVSDWAKINRGCRELLDQYNVHKDQAKLINWLHLGWGNPGPVNFEYPQGPTIRGLEEGVPGPKMYIAGWLPILPMCEKEGVKDRTIAFNYGTIEGEPSYPSTGLSMDGMKKDLDRFVQAKDGLAGVMANVQTPLLQMPHVYYYLATLWNADYRNRAERDVVQEVSEQIYPEHRQLLADAYAALKGTPPDKIEALAASLNGLINSNQLGQPGVLGRKLFPDKTIIARSLVLQLRFRAAQDRFFEKVGKATAKEEYQRLFVDVFGAYLSWDTATGWHDLWGQGWGVAGTPFFWEARLPMVLVRIRQTLGGDDKLAGLFDDVARELSMKHEPKRVNDFCMAFIKDIARNASASAVSSLAQKARATASIEPRPDVYPISHANDGTLNTVYWPSALVETNTAWIQLTWDSPQTFQKVKAHFLRHYCMTGRTIYLQKETSPGVWQNFATTVVKEDPGRFSVANFELPSPVTMDKMRMVNLFDLYEMVVH
jgi:hypothetical protein